jgi:hypothetical protein
MRMIPLFLIYCSNFMLYLFLFLVIFIYGYNYQQPILRDTLLSGNLLRFIESKVVSSNNRKSSLNNLE